MLTACTPAAATHHGVVPLPPFHHSYARTGKAARADFAAFSRAYLTQRPSLVMVLLLVDASIPPQALDLEYAAWLAGGARASRHVSSMAGASSRP